MGTAGTGAPFINGGDVKNTGVELALTWNDRIGKLNYNIGINGAYNKNKVGAIPNADGIIHGLTNMLYDNSKSFARQRTVMPSDTSGVMKQRACSQNTQRDCRLESSKEWYLTDQREAR